MLAQLLIAAGIQAGLVVYPYLVYPRLLQRLEPRPLEHGPGPVEPSVALLLCVHDEERALPAKLANIRTLRGRHPQLEVLVHDDASTDDTPRLLAEATDVATVVTAERRVGKAVGMRRLAERATADVLVLTDANALFEEDAIERLLEPYGDPEVAVVSGLMSYGNTTDGAVADVGRTYWSFTERLRLLESRSGSMMGAGGPILSVRRADYPVVPPHLLDDLITSMAPVIAGRRAVATDRARARANTVTTTKDAFRRRRRIACRAVNTHRHLAPSLRRMTPVDRWKWYSHRVLRWASAPLTLTLAATCVAALAAHFGTIAAATVAAAGGGMLVLAARLPLGPLSQLSATLSGLAGVTAGIIDSARGHTHQTWSPAESSRVAGPGSGLERGMRR